MKRKVNLTPTTRGPDLEEIVPCEISQSQRDRYCTLPLTGGTSGGRTQRQKTRAQGPRGERDTGFLLHGDRAEVWEDEKHPGGAEGCVVAQRYECT